MIQPTKPQRAKKITPKQTICSHTATRIKLFFKEMLIPARRSYLITTVFVLLFFFRQIVFYISPSIGYQLVGNLDIFYLIGIIYLILHYKKISKIEVVGILLLLLYPILQSFFNAQYNFLRAYINLTKIILCYFAAKETIEIVKKYKAEIKYGTMLFGYLCIASLVVALIFQHSPVLWRLNDTVNVFNLKRLKLFYTEPGELGMHCSIMLIISIYTATKVSYKLKYFLVAILPPIICLFFTKSLGGIAVGVVGVAAVAISDLCLNFSKKKLTFYTTAAFSAIVIALIAIISGSGMYLRVKKVFSNADSSSRYRIVMAFETVPDVLENTALLGTGFGNLELPHNVNKYQAHRLSGAGIINSYMNFIAEAGIVGIILLFTLIYTLIKACIRAKQPVVWGLTVFLVVYQFMGTYFTNPLIWILYGLIFAAKEHPYYTDNASITKQPSAIAKTAKQLSSNKKIRAKTKKQTKSYTRTTINKDSKNENSKTNKSTSQKAFSKTAHLKKNNRRSKK